MLSKSFVSAAILAGLASAAPTELSKRAAIDITVLQFALTLEHLENVFYKQALQNFTLQDFEHAGYSADYYNDLHYIAYDEQTHVQILQGALTANGVTPNLPCSYNFPYTDVKSFITLSSVLEDVGTSAYLGAAPLITIPAYLTVAGSILATEARHTAFQRTALSEVPMPNPLQTSLDPTSVYTLAAMFITSCPSSNMALPFTPFKTLTTDGMSCTCEEPECGNPSQVIKAKRNWPWSGGKEGNWPSGSWNPNQSGSCKPASAGSTVSFKAAGSIASGSFVTFVNGLSVLSVSGTVNGMDISAAVPAGIMGQTYVFITSKNENGTLSAADVEYGPAILEVNPPAPAIDYSEA
ncbi:hypothetical protein LTR62_005340 [Meristemomyces frigidus]|uniref:Uncharacterized protein n=1 Tax=Meristemomyces frigidus TaxID=1508187 RepID=A0AAN7TH14_9PEZI|nr:hypothetical protein LTR62_005340 [Meristemomyces frigidus]